MNGDRTRSSIYVAPVAPIEGEFYRTEPEWKKGLGAFVDETQALGGGLVGLGAQAIAPILPGAAKPYAEKVRNWGLESYKRNMEESTAGWQKPAVASLEDIKGVSDFGKWAEYQGAKGLATLGSMALSGGVGGAIAKTMTKQAVKDIAKAQIGKRLAGEIIGKGAKKAAQKEVARNITRGAIAGGAIGSFGLEGGESFGQQVTQEGISPEKALLPSIGVGAINAALELAAPIQIARKLGLGNWVNKGLVKAVKNDPEGLGKRIKNLAGKVIKNGVEIAATEGFTEGLQEVVQIAGERIAKDEELLAELSPEDRSQIINASAAGALVGGLAGGAAGPFVKTNIQEVKKENEAEIPATEETTPKETRSPGAGETVQPEIPIETPTPKGQLSTETVPVTPRFPGETDQEYMNRLTQEEGTSDELRMQREAGAGEEGIQRTEGPGTGEVTTTRSRIEEQVLERAIQEVNNDAKEIRKDESGLFGEGRIREGLQNQGRENRELSAEQGGQTSGEIPQEKEPLGAGMGVVEKTPNQVRKDIGLELGSDWVPRAEKSGLFEIVNETGPENRSAEWDPNTGKIRVYTKSLTEGSSAAQVLHEASHAGLNDLTEGRLEDFSREITNQAKEGKNETASQAATQATTARYAWLAKKLGITHNLWDTTGESLTKERTRVQEEVARRLENLSEPDRQSLVAQANEIQNEETFAYYVQYAFDKGAGGGLFRRAINSVKAGWLGSDLGRSLGKIGLRPKISDGLAVELARRSSKYAIEIKEELRRLGQEAKDIGGIGEDILEAKVRPVGSSQEVIDSQEMDDLLESRMEIADRSGNRAWIYDNPSLKQIQGLINRGQAQARQGNGFFEGVRILRDPRDGTLYVWDATSDLLHKDVAKEVGIDTEKYNIVPFSTQVITSTQAAEALLSMPPVEKLENRIAFSKRTQDANKKIREILSSPQPALDRFAEASQVDDELESRPPILTGEYWFTDPTSENSDIALGAGKGDRFIWNYLDAFQPLRKKAERLYDVFDLARSRKSAWQTRYREDYRDPLRDMVAAYAKKWKDRGQLRGREWIDDHLAAAHIVIDDVNGVAAADNSRKYVDKIIDELESSNRRILNPRTGKQKLVRDMLKEAKSYVLSGLHSDGTDAEGNKIVEITDSTPLLSGLGLRKEMADLVDQYMEYVPVVDGNQELRVEWEGLKRHAGGMSTGVKPTRWAARRNPSLEKAAQQEAENRAGSLPDAGMLFNDIKNDSEFDKIKTVANEIAQEKLKTLYEGGLITNEEYGKLKGSKQFYVPLRREGFAFEYGNELANLLQTGRGGGKQVKTRAGTFNSFSRKPIYIMQNLLASLDASRAAAERNIALNELRKEILKGNFKDWFSVIDKEEFVGRDKDGFVKERMSTQWEPTDVHLIDTGNEESKHLVIRPNRENQKAIQIARAINNLDASEIGTVLRAFRKVNNWIRNVNVAWSPAFLVTNAIRDPLTAAYNLKSSEAKDYVGQIFGEYGNSLRALRRVHLSRNRLRNPNDPDYQKVRTFEEAGGRTSFVLSFQEMDNDANSFNQELRKAMGEIDIKSLGINVSSPAAGKIFQLGKKSLDFLESANVVMENVMRLSAFTVLTRPKSAGGAGLSKERAARIAKDMTTNFTRKGNKTQALSTLYLFFNAAMQGNYQVWRNLTSEKNRKTLQKMVLGTIVFSFMLDQLGAAVSDDEDDDGRSDWDSIPDWEKERYIHLPFKIGGHYPKIPSPWVFNVAWRTGQLLGESTRGIEKPENLMVDIPALVFNTFNPLGQPPTLAQAITPTALDPVIQIAEGRGPFGQPLGPGQYPGAGWKPKSELAFSTTPEGYRDVARFLNSISGGSAAESGAIDLRPGDVELLTDLVIGSLGRFIGETAKVSSGQIEDMSEIPILKTFVASPKDVKESQLYHERTSKIFAAKKLEDLYKSGPQRDYLELGRVRQDRAGELRMVGMANDTERQLKDLRSQLRLAQIKGRDFRVNELRKKIDLAQTRFNRVWQTRVGN